MVVIRRSNEGWRIKMAAMAGGARDGFARVGHLADVLRVDFLHHADHESRCSFFGFRIVGKIQHGTAVGALLGGIGCVARAAFGAQ